MFRNALRQSSRSVAAVSATGRLASVSSTPLEPNRNIVIQDATIAKLRSIAGSMDILGLWIPLTSALTRASSIALSLTNFSIVARSARLPPALSLLLPSRSVHTQQRPRPLPLRSPPSSSRESVVSRRKLVLLRLDVSFPSGMLAKLVHLNRRKFRDLHQLGCQKYVSTQC